MSKSQFIYKDGGCYSVLLLIFVVAGCVRFYALDRQGLLMAELLPLAVCDAARWWDMAERFQALSGMPPLYPTLLCTVQSWTGNADFFARGLSACLGLVSVYFAYAIGRHIFSPPAGLLAAAAIATDFRTILIHREVSLYALLAAMLAVHAYCFFRLMLPRHTEEKKSLLLHFAGEYSRISWQWSPPLETIDARYLPGFIVSAITLVYCSPITLPLLLLELVISLWLVKSTARKILLKTVWLPVLVLSVPCLYQVSVYAQWVMDGNLFGLQALAQWRDGLGYFLSPDVRWLRIQAVLSGLAMLSLIFLCMRAGKNERLFLLVAVIVVQLLAAVLLLLVIPSTSPASFLFFWNLLIVLVLGLIVEALIGRLPAMARKTAIAVAVFGIVVCPLQAASVARIHERPGFSGFQQAARIVGADDVFLAGNGLVFASSDLFGYYLKKLGLGARRIVLPAESNVMTFLQDNAGVGDFYYLQHSPHDRNFQSPDAIYQQLGDRYRSTCVTVLPAFRITHFAVKTDSIGDVVPDCRQRTGTFASF